MSLKVEDLLIKMIKAINLFNGISDEAALDLAKDFNLNYYPANSIILKEGLGPNKIYILKNGKLEVKKSHGISSIKFGEIFPGDIFGEMSYFRKSPTMASVLSVQDSDVWEISIDKMDKFLQKNPAILDKIKKIMEKRQKDNEDNFKFIESKKQDVELDDLGIVL